MKICTYCLIEKTLDEFHKDSRWGKRVASRCKLCVSMLRRLKRATEQPEKYPDGQNFKALPKEERKKRQKESKARWKKEHPENTQKHRRAYRARKRGVYLDDLSGVDLWWSIVLDICGSKCLNCDTVDNLTHDHVRPLSLGGYHTFENSQVLCQPCNSSKGAKEIDYRTSSMLYALQRVAYEDTRASLEDVVS